MKRRFMILVVVAASACTRTQPTAPTGVPSAAAYVTRHFSGVVLTEDGRPVPPATVWLPSSRSASSNPDVNTTTDGNGSYQLALDQPRPWAGTYARVTQTLYEDTVADVFFSADQTDVRYNFRLYRSVTLAAGESAHLAITPDNSLCSDQEGYHESLCRRVHLNVPSSATLVLDTIADDPSNTFWLSNGDVVPSPFQTVTHVSRSMDTATTVVVLIFQPRPWNIAGAGGFTLKTALTP